MTVTAATRGRVIIIGGSMAGLFAAVSLRAQGWQVWARFAGDPNSGAECAL